MHRIKYSLGPVKVINLLSTLYIKIKTTKQVNLFIQVESCILVLRGRLTARMSWPTKLNGSIH